MNVFGLKGNENCQYKSEYNSSNSEMCYVALPSNCTDLINSSLYLGFQMSSEACTKLPKSVGKLEECNNVGKIWAPVN